MFQPIEGQLRRTRHSGFSTEAKISQDLKEFELIVKSGYIQVLYTVYIVLCLHTDTYIYKFTVCTNCVVCVLIYYTVSNMQLSFVQCICDYVCCFRYVHMSILMVLCVSWLLLVCSVRTVATCSYCMCCTCCSNCTHCMCAD